MIDFSIIADTSSVGALLGSTALITVGAGVVAAFGVPVINKYILPTPQIHRLADMLPFRSIERRFPDVIRLKNGGFVRVIKFKGLDTSLMGDVGQIQALQARKEAIDAIAGTKCIARFFTMRDIQTEAPPGGHINPLIKRIATQWNEQFSSTFQNDHYIVLETAPGKGAYEQLQTATDSVLTFLDAYKPSILSQIDSDGNDVSDLASFWTKIVSPITQPNPKGTGIRFDDVICADRLSFRDEEDPSIGRGTKGFFKFSDGNQTLYGMVVGLKKLGATSDEDFTRALTALPYRMTIMTALQSWDPNLAQIYFQQQQRFNLSAKFDPEIAAQFNEAMSTLKTASDKHQAFFTASFTVIVYDTDRRRLIQAFDEMKKLAALAQITLFRENYTAEASWFSQIPANQLWPTTWHLFSMNIATLALLNTPARGFADSDWGKGPLCLLRTCTGEAYRMQLHRDSEPEAPAHAFVMGPTGSGKTVLIAFLAAMSTRHPNLRTYFFDRYYGTEVFTRLAGGTYLNPDGTGDVHAALNPFSNEPTESHLGFLRNWLTLLVGNNDAEVSTQIGRAVADAYAYLPNDNRTLANLYNAYFSGDVKKSLEKWVDPNFYGRVFNSTRDTLNLSQRITSFDMTSLYAEGGGSDELAAAVISYIMHRIKEIMALTNDPSFIFIDETEPIIRNPQFKQQYIMMLQEMRKRRGAIISAFQRPEALKSSGIEQVLLGQASTFMFFKNPKAKPEDYAAFNLTDAEIDVILDKHPLSRRYQRAFLLKKPDMGESVLINASLSTIGPLINCFRSGEKAAQLARQLAKKLDGSELTEAYLDRITTL